MSRHSKWHKVRQFKGAIDAKRSASFTKLAREITVAVKEKGSDPGMNVRLRVAIEHAKKASMPRENIERAVARGSGGGTEGQLESLMYEAYAPGGTALIIECVTDNRNRTAGDVKHLLSKHGGTLAAPGAVTYLFERQGVVRVASSLPTDRRDEVELALIEAGAEEIKSDADGIMILSAPHDLAHIAEAAQQLGLAIETADMEWLPRVTVDIDEASGTSLETLLEVLEDLDDVARVYSNAS